MSVYKRFIQIGDTDFFVADENASDGRRKIDILNCKQQCLASYWANVNHPGAHSDECRDLASAIWEGINVFNSKSNR